MSPPITTTVKTEPANAIMTSSFATGKYGHQQTIQENEQFALAWLRATFEPVVNIASRIEQMDLYKMYITASSKMGRVGFVSPVHFPRIVRNVFGGTIGPNAIKVKQPHNNLETTTPCYEGIRIRAKPLAVIHKGTILVCQLKSHIS